MHKILLIFLVTVVSLPTNALKADMTIEQIGGSLDHPWGMDFLDANTLLVTERSGKLLRIDLENGSKTEISGIPKVHVDGQGGLLDVMVSPLANSNAATVWLCYAAPSENGFSSTTLGKGLIKGSTVTNFKPIFVAKPPINSSVHFGCRVGILPDGSIVATLGERGNRHNAQNAQVHPGSVIRLNPDGTSPTDNPYADGRDWLPELYSIGNRNPQGLAIHPTTGELWIHEHGPKGGDEINVVRGGENFGWPVVSYGEEYSGGKIGIGVSASGYTDSIHHWTPSIAPSGMAFYTGDMFPFLKNSLLVGSLKFRLLMQVHLDGDTVVSEQEMFRGQIGRIRDVTVGEDGAVYLLTDESDGGLWRLSQ